MTSLRANIFLVALGLSLLGTVMVYSATSFEYGGRYLVVRCVHLGLGLAAFWIASRVRYPVWRRLAPWIYLGVLASLILVLVPGIGSEIGGSRRWFDLGPISLQPAEFAKLTVVITLSCAVSRGRALRPGAGLFSVAGPLAAVGILFLLVLIEPDFDTSVLLLVGAAGVLWASEIRARDLMLAGGAAVAALAVVMVAEPYRRERFLTFLNPWSSPDGSGYQIVQALTAIKAGGFLGAGPGAGQAAASVPEVGTDMIFALIGEELGVAGMLAVIGAFGFLALAGFQIAAHAPSVMSRCLAAGITTVLCVQAIFNIGVTLSVFPLAGMTLPFVSYGGSSIMVSFAAIGILYRISEDSERAREVGQRTGAANTNSATGSERRERRGPEAPRVLIAGGGTGGHAIPALCVADSLRASGAAVVFVGSEAGIEADLVPRAGYPLHTLPLQGLSGGPLSRARAVLLFARALFRCRKILRDFRPKAVLGVGGYASAPAVLAANLLGIPTYLHEQNSVPGRVNRFAGRLTREVLVTFPKAAEHLPRAKRVGMPTRGEFFAASSETAVADALRKRGLEPPVVVIFGGSGGALRLNLAAAEAFRGETPYTVVQISGKRDFPRLSTDNPRHIILEYEPEIWELLSAADLVVIRSGAGSLFDTAAVGRAAILVPFPHATGDHQLHNARFFTERGAAELLPDADVTPETLRQKVEALLQDEARRRELATRIKQLATPEAAAEVAGRLLGATAVREDSAETITREGG